MKKDSFIKVAEIENQIEAQLIEDILSQEQLPFYIQTYQDLAYDGIFTLQLGWGGLYVPEALAIKVKALLREIMAEFLRVDHTDNHL